MAVAKLPSAPMNLPELAGSLVKPPAQPGATGGDMVPQAGVQQIGMTGEAPVNTNSFGPDNNLISTQINPSAPTATTQNTNYGTGAVAERAPIQTNYGTGAIQAGANPQSDPQFQKYTQGFDSALSNISNGPNRTQLARQALEDFDTEGLPQLEAGYRRVGQRAAALGRLGSGMTTNDLTGLSATYQRDRGLRARGLARDVAEGDINDRYRTADLYSNARGQQYGFGKDQRDYSTGVDQYNQGALFDRQRAGTAQENLNRDYGTGIDQYNQGASFARARAGNQDQADWQDRLFNQRRTGENDLRGERDFQTGRSDKAQEDAIRQRVMEEALLNQGFDRSQAQLNSGRYGNPADYMMDSAKQQEGEAQDYFGGAGGLLASNRAKQPVTNNNSVLTEELMKQIYGGMGGMIGR